MKPDIAYVYNKLKQLRFEFKESDRKLFPNEYTFDYGLDRYVRVDGNDLYIAKDTFKPLEEELEYADKCHKLEEEIGCPLEVIAKLFGQKFIYFKYPANVQIMKVKVTKGLSYGSNLGWYFTCIYDNLNFIYISLRDYKKTWWLKEDKSE